MHIPSTYKLFTAYGTTYLKRQGAINYTLAYNSEKFYSYVNGAWISIDKQAFTALLYKIFKLV